MERYILYIDSKRDSQINRDGREKKREGTKRARQRRSRWEDRWK